MRISDWSSDVCSSDLRPVHAGRLDAGLVAALGDLLHQALAGGVSEVAVEQRIAVDVDLGGQLAVVVGADEEVDVLRTLAVAAKRGHQLLARAARGLALSSGQAAAEAVRSEERVVGIACVAPCRSRGSP